MGPNGFEGLVKGKKALFITTSGGSYGLGSPTAAFNFLEPYLRAVFGFMGLVDLHFVSAENLNRGEDAARHAREMAENELRELAQTW